MKEVRVGKEGYYDDLSLAIPWKYIPHSVHLHSVPPRKYSQLVQIQFKPR
jgi:hypothetical protein